MSADPSDRALTLREMAETARAFADLIERGAAAHPALLSLPALLRIDGLLAASEKVTCAAARSRYVAQARTIVAELRAASEARPRPAVDA